MIATTWANTYVRDNTNALKAALDGTAVGFGTQFIPTTDGGYYLAMVSSDPRMIFDTSDYLWFLRSTNVWTVVIAGNSVLTADANGKITGKGFYDSGEISLAASASSNLTHGLGAKPRYIGGYLSTVTGEVAGTAATIPFGGGVGSTAVYVASVSSTTIVLTNTAGATRYGRVLAML